MRYRTAAMYKKAPRKDEALYSDARNTSRVCVRVVCKLRNQRDDRNAYCSANLCTE